VSLVANEQNLIPQAHKLTVEEASRGGIASGEARRARKTFKEELIALLEANDTNEKISVAIIKKALDGDIAAFTTIRDTIGEKPVTEQKIDLTENNHLSNVLAQLGRKGLGDDD
jgi:hypothetical protein